MSARQIVETFDLTLLAQILLAPQQAIYRLFEQLWVFMLLGRQQALQFFQLGIALGMFSGTRHGSPPHSAELRRRVPLEHGDKTEPKANRNLSLDFVARLPTSPTKRRSLS